MFTFSLIWCTMFGQVSFPIKNRLEKLLLIEQVTKWKLKIILHNFFFQHWTNRFAHKCWFALRTQWALARSPNQLRNVIFLIGASLIVAYVLCFRILLDVTIQLNNEAWFQVVNITNQFAVTFRATFQRKVNIQSLNWSLNYSYFILNYLSLQSGTNNHRFFAFWTFKFETFTQIKIGKCVSRQFKRHEIGSLCWWWCMMPTITAWIQTQWFSNTTWV